MPGRDLQPGLYRTTPVGDGWCKIESPTTPHAGTKEYAPDRKQYVGPDGQFTFVMVPVQGTEFMVRDGAPISVNGPCVWNKAN